MSQFEIFWAASEIDAPCERQRFLDEACGDNVKLRESVEGLLHSAKVAGGFMESPALVEVLDSLDDALVPRPGESTPAVGLESRTLGDYRIFDEIGRGGMGVVYEAEQISLGRRVALKVLSYASILDKTKLERFKIEAWAAASLDHPNVVHVYSVGSEQGVHYYAMQLIEGQTIGEVIAAERRRGLGADPGQTRHPSSDGSSVVHSVCEGAGANSSEASKDTGKVHAMSVKSAGGSDENERIRRVVQLVVQAAEALEHAHRMGIVHRDIKPSNLLVDDEQHLWVTDFGLAMVEADASLSATGSLIGTLRYMSPEQVRGDRHVLDHHTDIYSLGVTLYEMLTLQPAFHAGELPQLMQQVSVEEPPRLRKLNARIPRDLETVVLKAMAKNARDRYATASDLAKDLRRFLDDLPLRAKPPGVIVRAKKWAKRHRAIVATAIATLSVAVAVSGVLLWNERSQTLAAYTAEKEQHKIAHRNEMEARRQAQAADLARAAEAAARKAADQEKEKALAAQTEAETARERAEREAAYARESERLARQLVYAGDIRLAAQAWEDGDVRHYTDLLDRIRGGREDLRGFEWSYLRQLGSARYRSIAEETGGTCCVRYSGDGKYLAIGQHDGSIRLVDTQSLEVLADWQGHERMVRCIDCSPSGDRLVSIGDDSMIRLWSLPECRELVAFRACRGVGYAVLFALDGAVVVSCGEEPDVQLWDSRTGESVGKLTTEQAPFRALTVSPDGRYCVGTGSGIMLTWDLQERKRIGEHRGPLMRCLQFAPDGEHVAVGMIDQSIHLLHYRTSELAAKFEGHADDIQDLAFHPTGCLLASADRAGVIRTWPIGDNETGMGQDDANSFRATELASNWSPCFRAHSMRAWSLEFSPDGKSLLSGSKDGTVRVWTGRPSAFQSLAMTSAVQDLAFTPSDELLICGKDVVSSWNYREGRVHTLETGVAEEKYSLALAPGGTTIAIGDTHGTIFFWDRLQNRIVERLDGHEDDVDRIHFSPDGRLMLTASWDGTAKLWDAGSWEEYGVLHVPPHCYDAEFSSDGNLLAISSEDHAMLYDVASKRRLHLLQGHLNTAACLAFSPDGRFLATGSHDRTIRLWDVETGAVCHVIPAHQDKITAITFSPDGRTIASGDRRGRVAFSHVATGRFLYDVRTVEGTTNGLEFSADGLVLAAAVEDQVVLLDISRFHDDPAVEVVESIAEDTGVQ